MTLQLTLIDVYFVFLKKKQVISANAFNGGNVLTPLQTANLQQNQQHTQQSAQQQGQAHQNAQQQQQQNQQVSWTPFFQYKK